MSVTEGIRSRIALAVLIFGATGALVTLFALHQPAFAERNLGARSSERIVGTAGADHVLARRGADTIKGRDVCSVRPGNRWLLESCETTRMIGGGGSSGGQGSGGAIRRDPGTIEGRNCLTPTEDRLLPREPRDVLGRADDEDPRPEFSPELFATTITLDASVDGVEGSRMPISIEEVCDVPPALAAEAVQLAGGDGIATLGSQTQVYSAGQLVAGAAATSALMDADTLALRAHPLAPSRWGADEDGATVPTFAGGRIEITD